MRTFNRKQCASSIGNTARIKSESLRVFSGIRNYFAKARNAGVVLPDDRIIERIINDLTADTDRFRSEFDRYKQADRRYSAYDFNPIFPYPIVRPWRQAKRVDASKDRLAVPLPNLIPWRLSTGIYFKMLDTYPDFRPYFGHLFEAYVGRILEQSITGTLVLLTERDIRRFYPESEGKAPDFIVIDGDTAIFLESKATRFTRLALAVGGPEVIAQNLQQLTKALKQTSEFHAAIRAGRVKLPQLQQCSTFQAAVVTLEPLYLINSQLFRSEMAVVFSGLGQALPWHVFSIDELEYLQPHLAAGCSLMSVMLDLETNSMASVLERLVEQTGQRIEDTYLHREGSLRLYDWLGVPGDTD